MELKPSIYLYLRISVQQTNEVTISYFFYSLFIPPSVVGEPNEVTDYRCEEEYFIVYERILELLDMCWNFSFSNRRVMRNIYVYWNMTLAD